MGHSAGTGAGLRAPRPRPRALMGQTDRTVSKDTSFIPARGDD